MDAEQAYLFDLNGYIVIRGALSADAVASLLAVANEMKRLGKGEKPQGFQNDQHALHWHKAYRDLVDQPLVSPILSQLCGSAFRLDHVNVHARPATFPGGRLHGGDNPGGGNGFFGFRNGNFANGLVSVTYELEDTDCNPAGGGFCCIPGSHKANVSLPDKYRNLDEYIDENVRAIGCKAGDCIIFTEALTHGTLPWTLEGRTRTTLFYKFNTNGSSWTRNYLDPSDFADYEDMDERKLAILEPPYARNQNDGKSGMQRFLSKM